MRILICGDRNWQDWSAILRELIKYQPSLVIHGGARGADSIAGAIAEELGLKVTVFPAEWDLHGKAAGPIRNTKMLTEGNPDVVMGFHSNISESKGTKHMLRIAADANILTLLFHK